MLKIMTITTSFVLPIAPPPYQFEAMSTQAEPITIRTHDGRELITLYQRGDTAAIEFNEDTKQWTVKDSIVHPPQ